MREVIEKERTISSVASSYDLVPQTVGNWVARYRKEHATDQDREKASESAEIAKLRAEVRELCGENEFLKKAAALPRRACRRCPTRQSSVKPWVLCRLVYLVPVVIVPGGGGRVPRRLRARHATPWTAECFSDSACLCFRPP